MLLKLAVCMALFQMMQDMYQKCKLIHADLSEYNMLWHDSKLWFIDVSQSVEPTHPHALEFLYRDCSNVVQFFNKCAVPNVSPAYQLFLKVTQLDIVPNLEQDFLSQVTAVQVFSIFLLNFFQVCVKIFL